MTNRPLKAALLAAALLIAWAASSPVSSKDTGRPITEKEVSRYLKTMDRAVKALDVSAIMALLSKKVKITLITSGDASPIRLSLTYSEYEAYLTEVVKTIVSYDYSRRSSEIKISQNGKRAEVTYEIDEVLTTKTAEIRSVTKEHIVMERDMEHVRGRLLVVSIDGVVIESATRSTLSARYVPRQLP